MCPKDGKSANVLIKKADNALFYSKENGKNQVTAYQNINSAIKKDEIETILSIATVKHIRGCYK
jgi:predicted signal transduction protein with EAL and GGDEF domain